MVNKIIVILALLIILLVGGYFVYRYYENIVVDEEIITLDINIIAKENDKNIITNYTISNDYIENQFKNGTTLSYTYLAERVYVNKSVYIYNQNLESQNYYSDLHEINTSVINNYRVHFDLERPGEIIISQNGKFGLDDNINLTLQLINGNIYKNPKICLDWSVNIITAYIKDLKKESHCYDLKEDFIKENNTKTVTLEYRTFGNLRSNDYINIELSDYDNVYKKSLKKYDYKLL